MTTSTAIAASADHQPPLPLRRRADLELARTSLRGVSRWTVKDPVASRFYQLSEEEQFVLEQLAEPLSWTALQQRINGQFAPRRITRPQLEAFVALLHREGLLVSTASGQAPRLLERRQQQSRRARWQRLLSPLAVRFRGVNPDRLLDWLAPRLAWACSPPALLGAVLLLAATLLMLVGRLPQIAAELPGLPQFFTSQALLWLAVAIGVSKVLHELGHALACKWLGGRCQELGVMLLVLVPCLYCNVSDAWMLRSKWKRMAVSGAGIGVELLLACGGLWVWWMTEPGWLHGLSLSLAVVCSVNTLLLNGNPLLRYDGYFVLADYWEIPNLFQQSRDRLKQLVVRWTTGVELPAPLGTPAPDRLLLPYAVASILYRWFVVLAIWWVLWHGLQPWGLELLANLMLTLTVIGMLGPVVWSAGRFLTNPLRGERSMRVGRLGVTAAVTATLLLAAALAPLPTSVTAPAVLAVGDAVSLRVVAPGSIQWAAAEGADLEAGDVVARLTNLELQRELSQARGEQRLQQQRVAALTEQLAKDPQAEAALVVAEQSLSYYRHRAAQLELDAQRLEIVAPRAGRVFAPRRRDEGSQWRGTPLDPANRGAVLELDDLIGTIGTPSRLEAVAVVPQREIADLAIGQRVTLSVHAAPASRLTGAVIEISEVDSKRPGDELIAAGLLAGSFAGGNAAPRGGQASDVVFQVRIRIDAPPELPVGGLAAVKIHGPPRTAWQRIGRGLAGLLQP